MKRLSIIDRLSKDSDLESCGSKKEADEEDDDDGDEDDEGKEQ